MSKALVALFATAAASAATQRAGANPDNTSSVVPASLTFKAGATNSCSFIPFPDCYSTEVSAAMVLPDEKGVVIGRLYSENLKSLVTLPPLLAIDSPLLNVDARLESKATLRIATAGYEYRVNHGRWMSYTLSGEFGLVNGDGRFHGEASYDVNYPIPSKIPLPGHFHKVKALSRSKNFPFASASAAISVVSPVNSHMDFESGAYSDISLLEISAGGRFGIVARSRESRRQANPGAHKGNLPPTLKGHRFSVGLDGKYTALNTIAKFTKNKADRVSEEIQSLSPWPRVIGIDLSPETLLSAADFKDPTGPSAAIYVDVAGRVGPLGYSIQAEAPVLGVKKSSIGLSLSVRFK